MKKEWLRHSNVWVVIGARQTGKTSLLLETLKGKKVLFISYSPMDAKMRAMPVVKTEHLKYLREGAGVYRVDVSPFVRRDGKKNDIYLMLEDIRAFFFNGHVVFDDIMPIIGYNPNGEFKTGLISCRHNCNDIYFIFHNPNNVAPFLYEQAGYILMFKTGNVNIAKSINKMNRADEIMKMWQFTQRKEFASHDYCFICTDPVEPLSYEPFQHIKNTHE